MEESEEATELERDEGIGVDSGEETAAMTVKRNWQHKCSFFFYLFLYFLYFAVILNCEKKQKKNIFGF